MGFKRPLVRFQSLGPKWEKPLKLLSFDGFFFCLFALPLFFNALEFYNEKGDSSTMKKRLKATTIDENFRTFLASKRSSGVREKTILSYQQAYQAVNRHCPIGEMDMTAFRADSFNALIDALLRANLSRNSIHTYTVALASFFNWCKTEGISRYTFKPYKGEETVKTPYTDAELKQLLRKPNLKRCDFSEYRSWVIINLLLNCGCRVSTVRIFQVRDLDLENRVLFTRHIKNNRPQPLPLCSDMVAILQEYLTYREGKANEPLFPSDADKPMTENGLRCSIANDNRRRGGKRLPSTFSDTPLPASILSIAEAMRSHSKSC